MLTRIIGLVIVVALPIEISRAPIEISRAPIEISRAPIDKEGYIKAPELIARLVSLAGLIIIILEDISPFTITNLTYLLVLLRLFLM